MEGDFQVLCLEDGSELLGLTMTVRSCITAIKFIEHIKRTSTHFPPNLAALNKSRASNLEAMFNGIDADPLELTFLFR